LRLLDPPANSGGNPIDFADLCRDNQFFRVTGNLKRRVDCADLAYVQPDIPRFGCIKTGIRDVDEVAAGRTMRANRFINCPILC